MNNLDFGKYKDLKFHESSTLFPPDLSLVKRGVCPLCLCKLYEMRGRPIFYCRSKKHKKRFIVSSSKISL